jgi:urea transport system substrate-binding protein
MSPILKKPLVLLALALAALLGAGVAWRAANEAPPIRIGVLHSLTGAMAASEKPLIDAVRLAVEELNAAGGLLGRQVEMVVADTRSDPQTAAAEARRLIEQERVSALFGCWTSACRKAVKPVVERYKHLLFYPVQYEGLEQSSNILYTGLAPNQQIIPGTRWAMEQFGKRVYLVGSDYVFPRAANLMIRDLVSASGGEIVAEHYVPLKSAEMAAIIADIRRSQPGVLLNTLNGDSNNALFAALEQAGLADLPLLSFSVAESEMTARGGARLTQHYGVWNYFQGLPGAENTRFVSAFKARFGKACMTSDPLESAYVGVRLWAQAVREERSADPRRINAATLLRQSIAAPSGPAAVDAATRHLWKSVRIVKVRPDGAFEQVSASSLPLRPAPWPAYRTRGAWLALLGTVTGKDAP